MRFHIIGPAHELQESANPNTRIRDLLRYWMDVRDAALIAEEVNADEDVQTCRELIAEDKWLSIDMPAEEQKARGIYEALNRRPDRDLHLEWNCRVTEKHYSAWVPERQAKLENGGKDCPGCNGATQLVRKTDWMNSTLSPAKEACGSRNRPRESLACFKNSLVTDQF